MLWRWNEVLITPEGVRLPSGAWLEPRGLMLPNGSRSETALYAIFDDGQGLTLSVESIRERRQVHLPAAFGSWGTPGWRLVPAEQDFWPWLLGLFRTWQAGCETSVLHIAGLAWPLRALWSATALGLILHPDHPMVVV